MKKVVIAFMGILLVCFCVVTFTACKKEEVSLPNENETEEKTVDEAPELKEVKNVELEGLPYCYRKDDGTYGYKGSIKVTHNDNTITKSVEELSLGINSINGTEYKFFVSYDSGLFSCSASAKQKNTTIKEEWTYGLNGYTVSPANYNTIDLPIQNNPKIDKVNDEYDTDYSILQIGDLISGKFLNKKKNGSNYSLFILEMKTEEAARSLNMLYIANSCNSFYNGCYVVVADDYSDLLTVKGKMGITPALYEENIAEDISMMEKVKMEYLLFNDTYFVEKAMVKQLELQMDFCGESLRASTTVILSEDFIINIWYFDNNETAQEIANNNLDDGDVLNENYFVKGCAVYFGFYKAIKFFLAEQPVIYGGVWYTETPNGFCAERIVEATPDIHIKDNIEGIDVIDVKDGIFTNYTYRGINIIGIISNISTDTNINKVPSSIKSTRWYEYNNNEVLTFGRTILKTKSDIENTYVMSDDIYFIEDNCFFSYKAAEIILSKNLVSIGQQFLSESDIENIDLSVAPNLNCIGEYSFTKCFDLKTIKFGLGMSDFTDYILQYPLALIEITFLAEELNMDYDFLKNISEKVELNFVNCEDYTVIDEAIYQYVKNGLKLLMVLNKDITAFTALSNTVELGDSCFSKCNKITALNLNENLERIGNDILVYNNISSVFNTSKLKYIGTNNYYYIFQINLTLNDITQLDLANYNSTCVSIYLYSDTVPVLVNNNTSIKIYVPSSDFEKYRETWGTIDNLRAIE